MRPLRMLLCLLLALSLMALWTPAGLRAGTSEAAPGQVWLVADSGHKGKGNKGQQGPGKNKADKGKNAGKMQEAGPPPKGKAQGAGDFNYVPKIGPRDARDLARRYHLTGYKPLPPGIRKNLMRGQPLPPGIAKKMVPRPMLEGLPAYPGHEWQVVGNDLVLLAVGTSMVVDVLSDIFQ